MLRTTSHSHSFLYLTIKGGKKIKINMASERFSLPGVLRPPHGGLIYLYEVEVLKCSMTLPILPTLCKSLVSAQESATV